jgi:hypothetical protein
MANVESARRSAVHCRFNRFFNERHRREVCSAATTPPNHGVARARTTAASTPASRPTASHATVTGSTTWSSIVPVSQATASACRRQAAWRMPVERCAPPDPSAVNRGEAGELAADH